MLWSERRCSATRSESLGSSLIDDRNDHSHQAPSTNRSTPCLLSLTADPFQVASPEHEPSQLHHAKGNATERRYAPTLSTDRAKAQVRTARMLVGGEAGRGRACLSAAPPFRGTRVGTARCVRARFASSSQRATSRRVVLIPFIPPAISFSNHQRLSNALLSHLALVGRRRPARVYFLHPLRRCSSPTRKLPAGTQEALPLSPSTLSSRHPRLQIPVGLRRTDCPGPQGTGHGQVVCPFSLLIQDRLGVLLTCRRAFFPGTPQVLWFLHPVSQLGQA